MSLNGGITWIILEANSLGSIEQLQEQGFISYGGLWGWIQGEGSLRVSRPGILPVYADVVPCGCRRMLSLQGAGGSRAVGVREDNLLWTFF